MDFESIKEQIIERLKFYKNQIEDSEIYIRLKERYDTLQPNVQKAIKFGGIFFLIYFFYSIPASFVSSSSEKMQFFEENRLLTRDLIRAGRIAKTVSLPPMPPSTSSLENTVDRIIMEESILPEQKMSVTPQTNIASKTLVPKSIKQGGVKASLKQLNLRQAIRVGEALSEIDSSQLMNMVILADQKDPHYFHVEFEVATFDVPRTPLEDLTPQKGKGKKFNRNKRKPRGSK